MALNAGTRLGAYEVLAAIGAGGMGEVYRARDTRLDRTVAIKVLAPHVASDPDFRQRFEREGRAVAALNHPHICTLHDIGHQDGIDYLVMEYLEGQTLAERLEKGPLPIDQVLRYAIEMVDAVDKAHRQGIIHRDLKPGNIFLVAPRESRGRHADERASVKLLDFGLAKASASSVAASSLSMLPTTPPVARQPMGEALTAQGTILGTFQYMAPEQLEGKDADARTDIFAFGCVLYEMLTAKKAFQGKTHASLIGAIMHAEPQPIGGLQPLAPPALEQLVRTCLAKDPDDRYQTAHDLLLTLRSIGAAPATLAGAAAPLRRWRRIAAYAAVLAVVAGASSVATWLAMPAVLPSPMRFTIATPPTEPYTTQSQAVNLAVSPDGRHVAYQVLRGTTFQFYLRAVDRLEGQPVIGTENAATPFFSPDGGWLGFYSIRERKLKRVALSGGPAQAICDIPVNVLGVSWGAGDAIIFAQGGATGGGLFRVSARGGRPERVTTPDVKNGEREHRWPEILPGGRAVVFTVMPSADIRQARIAVLNLETKEQKVLVEGGSFPRYAPTGHLLYGHVGTLMAVPFDVNRLEVAGTPVPVQERIVTKAVGAANFGVAGSGMLIYTPGGAVGDRAKPVWVGRDGRELPPLVDAELETAQFPRLAPDGRRVVLTVAGDLWVYDLEGRPPIKLTFDGGSFASLWTPDGQRIVYEASSGALFAIPADGSGRTPEQISPDGHYHPHGFSSDGREILVAEVGTPNLSNLRKFQVGSKGESQVVVQTEYEDGFAGAALSPDGRWLAYVTDVTGQTEVWVRPYAGPGAPVRVSPRGGVEPVWARTGRELYYLEGDKLMTVAVETQPTFRFKPPVLLFEARYQRLGQPPSYDVAPDGRFLMLKSAGPRAAAPEIVVVLNWFEELKRRVPTR